MFDNGGDRGLKFDVGLIHNWWEMNEWRNAFVTAAFLGDVPVDEAIASAEKRGSVSLESRRDRLNKAPAKFGFSFLSAIHRMRPTHGLGACPREIHAGLAGFDSGWTCRGLVLGHATVRETLANCH